jgi:lipid A 4'-phosphatase
MKPIIILFLLVNAILAFFWLSPEIDIWFSRLFYKPDTGFFWAEHPVTIFIYDSVEIITTTIALLLFLNIGGKFLQLKTTIVCDSKKLLTQKASIFLLLVLALGPGLFVHQGLKENMPRPRPKHIIEFGGTQEYARPLEIREGISGKSFVSGHAAAAFFLAAFALLFRSSKLKFFIYSGGVFWGLVAGISRIVQGKHFLSDIILSGIFTLLIAHILFWIMFEFRKHPE